MTPASGAAVPAAASSKSTIALIDEGNALEEQGRVAEAMDRYDAAVLADPRCARAHLNRGNVLLAGASLDGARSAYELAVACDPSYAAAHFNLGNLNTRVGEFAAAISNYQRAAGLKPDFADAYVAMANAFDSLGSKQEALDSYQRALAIRPDYAEVHFNIAVLAISQGRLGDAATSLRMATELRPDYDAAHRTLGVVLKNLGDDSGAETSLRHASSLKPDSPEILRELAAVLESRGKREEATGLFLRVLERAPGFSSKADFAACASRTVFTRNDRVIRLALTAAVTEAWAMPLLLCRSALNLVLLDERIEACVHRANEAWPTRLPAATLFGADGLAALAADPLLHAVLQSVPVSSLPFERFLTCARHALLEIASRQQGSPADLAALPFFAALARQCFINEYVFDVPENEQSAAAACQSQLRARLDANAVIPPLLLLAAASYSSLATLADAGRLLAAAADDAVGSVLDQQVRQPLEEQKLRATIKRLTPISAGVSEQVREQYEENPYPRWVSVPRQEHPRLNAALRRLLPFAAFTPRPDDSAPEVLVAGCGTGSHAIIAAQRFAGSRVLAIDLSLSSLSYAVRKIREMRISNIEFAQADVLRLGEIGRRFDVIESVGVLHHMRDPFAGWRVLLSLLRPGGFMALGFYSEIARRYLLEPRALIAARGYAGTPGDIRRFRQEILMSAGADLRQLVDTQDFYSTSECRDLLFHVQEHRLTLGQIESFLAESGLQFIGFELDPQILKLYRDRFSNDPRATNLRNWARFEADNPQTFSRMYKFWIQKPS
jgi:tetratricopeptide (TPR) repeat protein/SAM-dependent methyltransferase